MLPSSFSPPGSSLNDVSFRITKNIAGVHFPTPEVGYAVPYTYGGGVDYNEVIKTLDGGATWTLLPHIPGRWYSLVS